MIIPVCMEKDSYDIYLNAARLMPQIAICHSTGAY